MKGFLSFEQTVHQNSAFSNEKVISSNIHMAARGLIEVPRYVYSILVYSLRFSGQVSNLSHCTLEASKRKLIGVV